MLGNAKQSGLLPEGVKQERLLVAKIVEEEEENGN